jgi:hypothetical protein
MSYQLESWYNTMLPGEVQQRDTGNYRATIHDTHKGAMEATINTKRDPGPATATCKRKGN